MLPYSQYSNADFTQFPAYFSVALPVPGDFCLPKTAVDGWYMAATGTAVPEAAVDEDR